MANTKTPDDWNQDDAVELRGALTKLPRFLRALRKKMPRSEKSATRDEAANHGERMEGYLNCIDQIERMMQDQTPQNLSAERNTGI